MVCCSGVTADGLHDSERLFKRLLLVETPFLSFLDMFYSVSESHSDVSLDLDVEVRS